MSSKVNLSMSSTIPGAATPRHQSGTSFLPFRHACKFALYSFWRRFRSKSRSLCASSYSVFPALLRSLFRISKPIHQSFNLRQCDSDFPSCVRISVTYRIHLCAQGLLTHASWNDTDSRDVRMAAGVCSCAPMYSAFAEHRKLPGHYRHCRARCEANGCGIDCGGGEAEEP